MPPEMRDDTAFMDLIHAYLLGWDVPKMRAELFTGHFGLVSDFLSESRVSRKPSSTSPWAALWRGDWPVNEGFQTVS